jgi:hypothetical protein
MGLDITKLALVVGRVHLLAFRQWRSPVQLRLSKPE